MRAEWEKGVEFHQRWERGRFAPHDSLVPSGERNKWRRWFCYLAAYALVITLLYLHAVAR